MVESDPDKPEVIFRFDVPLYIHTQEGVITRVVVDDDHPLPDQAPLAVIHNERADSGWGPSDEIPPTDSDVELWQWARKTDWPGWDFSW